MTTSTTPPTESPKTVYIPFVPENVLVPFNCKMRVIGEFDGGHRQFIGKLAKDFVVPDEQWAAMLHLAGINAQMLIYFSCKRGQEVYAYSASELASWLRKNGCEVVELKTEGHTAYTARITSELAVRISKSCRTAWPGINAVTKKPWTDEDLIRLGSGYTKEYIDSKRSPGVTIVIDKVKAVGGGSKGLWG